MSCICRQMDMKGLVARVRYRQHNPVPIGGDADSSGGPRASMCYQLADRRQLPLSFSAVHGDRYMSKGDDVASYQWRRIHDTLADVFTLYGVRTRDFYATFGDSPCLSTTVSSGGAAGGSRAAPKSLAPTPSCNPGFAAAARPIGKSPRRPNPRKTAVGLPASLSLKQRARGQRSPA